MHFLISSSLSNPKLYVVLCLMRSQSDSTIPKRMPVSASIFFFGFGKQGLQVFDILGYDIRRVRLWIVCNEFIHVVISSIRPPDVGVPNSANAKFGAGATTSGLFCR